MTQRLGLTPQRDEYKVAQMAQKGDPNKFKKIIMPVSYTHLRAHET